MMTEKREPQKQYWRYFSSVFTARSSENLKNNALIIYLAGTTTTSTEDEFHNFWIANYAKVFLSVIKKFYFLKVKFKLSKFKFMLHKILFFFFWHCRTDSLIFLYIHFCLQFKSFKKHVITKIISTIFSVLNLWNFSPFSCTFLVRAYYLSCRILLSIVKKKHYPL